MEGYKTIVNYNYLSRDEKKGCQSQPSTTGYGNDEQEVNCADISQDSEFYSVCYH